MSRGRPSRSTIDPAGPANAAPVSDPAAITHPISGGLQCATCASQVERNGPSPPPTSAMKKFTAGSA